MSAHYYSYREESQGPVPVTVEVVRVRPYEIVYKQTIEITDEGQVADFYQFTVYDDGTHGEVTEATESAVATQQIYHRSFSVATAVSVASITSPNVPSS
ncbi:MAG TPA: hypothetical protein DDW91_09670 [Shewanella frigidimarina]|nr:hypothetical protein [Shewanella frigidimarina]